MASCRCGIRLLTLLVKKEAPAAFSCLLTFYDPFRRPIRRSPVILQEFLEAFQVRKNWRVHSGFQTECVVFALHLALMLDCQFLVIASLVHWSIDWLIDRLIDWLIDWLTDWQEVNQDWLTDLIFVANGADLFERAHTGNYNFSFPCSRRRRRWKRLFTLTQEQRRAATWTNWLVCRGETLTITLSADQLAPACHALSTLFFSRSLRLFSLRRCTIT